MEQLSLLRQKGSKTMSTAKLTDLQMTDKTTASMDQRIPRQYLHSDSQLKKTYYTWVGELPLESLESDDSVVVIDAWAYRQRHQESGRIIRLRTGGFPKGEDFQHLKLMGVVRGGKLMVITEIANKKVRDIAPRTPVRIAGIGSAMSRFRKAIGQ